ncbi:MAG TPA: hypothetical protein PK156_41515, partial [Polyangium sp.]|nr:hypothetical protein [Polyangium sp.]
HVSASFAGQTLALILWLFATPVWAQTNDSDALPRPVYSLYERETIAEYLRKHKRQADETPDGKTIEAVDIVSLDVIEKRDPAPGFLNIFHVRTRKYVIRRELLLEVGQQFRQDLADETGRNLRAITQFSLVLVFAVKGSAPDRVRLVVATKDVWSLRLNTDFRLTPAGGFEYLVLQPSEVNLLGTQHTAAVNLLLQPETLAVGARYIIPRVGGSRILLQAETNVVFNRETGKAEGSNGTLNYGQPLFSTRAKWSYLAKVGWKYEIDRRYVRGKLALYDAPSTEAEEAIPFRYRSDILAGSYTLLRSFGIRTKHDFSMGIEANRRVYRADDLSSYDPDAANEFVAFALPRSDTRVGPFVQMRAYTTRFMRTIDLNTLGLQEDIRVGHDLYLRLYPVFRAIGASRNFVGTMLSASYTVPLGDGLVRGYAEGVVEAQPDRIADASIDVGLRVHSPRTRLGRLIADARIFSRIRNYMNRRSVLGGDTRLRGYATQGFFGEDVVACNLEFRTRSINILSVQTGAVAFWDMGDAFDGFADMQIKHGVGLGLRAVFPQFSRTAWRIDWGVPLTRSAAPNGPFPGEFVLTFEQAFPLATVPVRDF